MVVLSEGGKISGVRGVVDGDDEGPQGSEEGVATVEEGAGVRNQPIGGADLGRAAAWRRSTLPTDMRRGRGKEEVRGGGAWEVFAGTYGGVALRQVHHPSPRAARR